MNYLILNGRNVFPFKVLNFLAEFFLVLHSTLEVELSFDTVGNDAGTFGAVGCMVAAARLLGLCCKVTFSRSLALPMQPTKIMHVVV